MQASLRRAASAFDVAPVEYCNQTAFRVETTASDYGRQNFDLSGNYCVQRKKDGMFPFRPDFPTLHNRVTFGVFNNFENFHFVARAAVDVDKVLT